MIQDRSFVTFLRLTHQPFFDRPSRLSPPLSLLMLLVIQAPLYKFLIVSRWLACLLLHVEAADRSSGLWLVGQRSGKGLVQNGTQ